jgi:hypothetical protein
MVFDCPPSVFKPRISHDGWQDNKNGPLWAVTNLPGGDFHIFDSLGEATAYIRKEFPA